MVKHGSEQCTVAALRERFWVNRARQQVRRVLQSCLFCKRYAKVDYTVPDAAKSAAERLSSSPSFTFILLVQQAYTCTCASSRAVHVEVTQTLSVTSFMRALKRFVARRGASTVIFSDNGRTFKRASAEVKKIVFFCVLNSNIQALSEILAWNMVLGGEGSGNA